MPRTVYVVPHCHWDREWYQPHELFRWRLVQMIDELLDHMEAHPEYRCFNLDGQSIVIDDYLELRPENEGRLRALIESGRIVIGPWWVQPDEFLPSGESHIRSFQRGIRFAERMGGSLKVGHCADQFGHIAQMPQIMAQLGLTSACLWRGVPDAILGWGFWWEAPDGTRLPVLYLRNSYSSGWRLPEDPDDLLERVRRQERDLREGLPAVLMNGTDHSRMEAHVPAALERAAGRGYDFRMATLADYEQAVLAAGIEAVTHHGELRSPDRSNVLAGVLSARMNIKQRDFEVSGALEKYAEPLELLAYLHRGPDGSPALRQAWRLLLENSPHDSICGCSVDQTHREMFPRYDRAEQLARQVARESLAHLARNAAVPAGGGLAVFRPVAGAPAVLEADVPLEWASYGRLRLPDGSVVPYFLDVESAAGGEIFLHEAVSPRGAHRHLDFLREQRYDNHAIEAMEWELDGRHLRVTTTVGQDVTVIDEASVREGVRQVAANNLADTAEVTVRRSQRARLRAVLPASQAIGLQVLTPFDSGQDDPAPGLPDRGIANEYYEVRLRKGKLLVRDWQHGIDVANANAFVSEGDRGDEYNADILPDAVIVPIAVEEVERTANRACSTLRYVTWFQLPARLNRKRTRRARREQVVVPITTEVTLWNGVPRVDFRVTVENQARDHRLRTLFPLPFAVEHAITENQFHVSERPVTPPPWNGLSNEQPPATFPQKTFAAFEAGGMGMAVFNCGLQEGEVVRGRDGRQAYALTLLRCVGWLSRPDLVSRRGGAGPTISTEDSQMQGTHSFAYSLATYRGSWRENAIQALAHALAYPPMAIGTNEHEGSLGLDIPLARLPAGLVPTALCRSDLDGAPILRLYNASGAETAAEIQVPGAAPGASVVDLLERTVAPAEPINAGWRVALREWQIASLRFGRA